MRKLLIILVLLLIPRLALPACPPGSVSARDFGAQGNGSADDTAALQAFILKTETVRNGALQSGCIPWGVYKTTFPLVISDPNGVFPRIEGAGGLTTVRQQTTIGSGTVVMTFPAVVIIPGDYITSLGTIAASPIVGSTGNALQFNAKNGYGLLMNETPMVGMNSRGYANPLNRLTDLLFQCFFKTTDTNGTHHLLVSTGDGFDSDGAIDLKFTVGGTITATINVGGSEKTVPAAGTVSADTVYWVALEKDSTNNKIWLYLAAPGTTGIAPLSSASATGTIKQAVAEGLWVGGLSSALWPSQAPNDFHGRIQSLDIEKVSSLRGRTVTAPSANFTFGSDTIYGNDFTTITPTKNGVSSTPFVSIDYLNGTAQSDAWQFIWNPTYDGNARGVDISNLALHGGTIGLLWAMAPQSFFKDITIGYTGYAAFWAFNNTYNSIIDSMYIDNLYSGDAFGFGCSWSTGSIRNLSVTGGYYPIAAGSYGCGSLYDPITTGASATISDIRIGAAASSFTGNNIYNAEIDNESGGNTNALEILGPGLGFINIFGGDYLSAGTGVPILMDGNGGPVTNVTAARLFNGTRSAADIYYSGLSSLPIVNLFETTIIDFTGGVAPITNQPSVIRIEGGPSDVLTTLNGTTAGTAVSSEPTISPTKKTFRIYLKGYENTTATAQTIAIPVAFATAMSSVDTVSGTCLGVTATTTMVRLPSSMTGTQTGLCEFAGY